MSQSPSTSHPPEAERSSALDIVLEAEHEAARVVEAATREAAACRAQGDSARRAARDAAEAHRREALALLADEIRGRAVRDARDAADAAERRAARLDALPDSAVAAVATHLAAQMLSALLQADTP
jgi:hypothetical protein